MVTMVFAGQPVQPALITAGGAVARSSMPSGSKDAEFRDLLGDLKTGVGDNTGQQAIPVTLPSELPSMRDGALVGAKVSHFGLRNPRPLAASAPVATRRLPNVTRGAARTASDGPTYRTPGNHGPKNKH